jgi:chemotaxis family two-component system sensor kinase Cph1
MFTIKNTYMIDNEFLNQQTVDLTNCDKEAIHIPGSIQPHGLLFVLEEPELKIIQVSQNTFQVLGIHPQELLNQHLETLLDSQQIINLRQCVSEEFESVNPLKISINTGTKTLIFDGIIHQSNGLLILELEPSTSQQEINFFNFYQVVKSSLTKIQNASNLDELCTVIVKEVRRITKFDRVLVYQFDEAGAGTVIAEDKLETLSPYLGLHYPPSDIPKQAKQLYTLNWLRIVPNINYQPVGLFPSDNPVTNAPLDLSYSVLRSVSPIHIEYLKNMGVTASMSISLIKNKKLWGLIACHHNSPKYLSYELRTACEFLGRVASLELAAKEDNEDLEYKIKINSLQARLVEVISQSQTLLDGLVNVQSQLLELVSAQGVAICIDGQHTLIGETPNEAEITQLVEWVIEQTKNNVFSTDSLPKIYPEAEKFKDVASGLLALSISKLHKSCILWFRSEVIHTVNWGGNPNKPVEVEEDGSLRLSPRKSFELWQETVKLKSLPWKQCEIDVALELRSAIVGIVLRKVDELAKINVELERSNSELDAFAYIASHDLKEPLRGIHNYSNFLIEDYGDLLNEDGVSKLQTLVRLTQRMEDLIDSLLHFSRLGRIELSMQQTNLNNLVNNVVDVLKISLKDTKVDIRIPQPLPNIHCDSVQVSEVFSNLISNGIKYNNKPEKWVEIGFLDSKETLEKFPVNLSDENQEQVIVFYVKDNGIGIPEKHWEAIFKIFKRLHTQHKYGGGTGAGLTIAKKIVERHGGILWVESIYGEGSTFYFTLSPSKVLIAQ